MGLIWWWARAAALAPGLANGALRSRLLGGLLKRAAGVHPRRRLPAFAPETFRCWFARERAARPRSREGAARTRVLLFPDTFNDHFSPQVAIAALQVLEEAGCEIVIPRRELCCGRSLYAWGMLDTAKRLLTELLDALEPEIVRETPMLVLEPACCSTFRDELVNLLPQDPRAHALAAHTFTLAELLERLEGFVPPRLEARALVHVHCNHHAVLKFGCDAALLGRTGLQHRILDSGCCGMAGSFGFEREHYELSMRCAERVLLPEVRAAAPEELILADGFSCREQIVQGTGRAALHLAELLRHELPERRVSP